MALTRSETIREAWRTAIWDHADIQDITEVLIEHDISEDSFHELARLRSTTTRDVNFFAFRVSRGIQYMINNKISLLFSINISYVRRADPDGLNYNLALDAIETLQELVVSELGTTWSSTVGGSMPQNEPPSIAVTTIGEERVFKADYNYQGFITLAN